MIYTIKLLLGISDTSKDDLLTALLNDTIEEVQTYIRSYDLDGLESVINQIVVIKYNRLTSEGLSSESYNGASFGYLSDYPESIQKALKAKRRVQFA